MFRVINQNQWDKSVLIRRSLIIDSSRILFLHSFIELFIFILFGCYFASSSFVQICILVNDCLPYHIYLQLKPNFLFECPINWTHVLIYFHRYHSLSLFFFFALYHFWNSWINVGVREKKKHRNKRTFSTQFASTKDTTSKKLISFAKKTRNSLCCTWWLAESCSYYFFSLLQSKLKVKT